MKKKIAFLTALMMLAGSLAGCGDKAEKTTGGDSGEVMTIDWMPQNDSPVDAESPVVKMLEEKFGVKFNFIYLDRNKEVELLNIRIAGGEIPDVMRRNDSIYRNFIEQGVISEIPEELVKETAPTVYESTKKYGGDNLWDVAKEDGKLYGLPLLNDNGRYHAVTIWRDDWLKKVGINKIPETVDEAEQAFYKFVSDDPDGNGQKDTYALSTNGISAILNAYGGHPLKYYWTERDGKIISSAILPEMKEGLIRLNKWYKDGLIDPEFITGENKGQHFASTVVFWNGRIGFSMPGMAYHVSPPFIEGSSGSVNWSSFHQIQGEDASYTWGTPLKGPEGKMGAEHWGVFSGDYFLMGKNVKTGSDKMKKILEINEVLNTDFDTFILARNGRKDIDYVDDGAYTSKLDAKQRQALGLNANGIVYMTNNLEFIEKSEVPEQRAFSEKYGNITKEYTNLVWGGLPSDSMYKSVVEQKIQENYYAFISGARDINEFDQFVTELNSAGLEQLTKEANEWYDERYRNQ